MQRKFEFPYADCRKINLARKYDLCYEESGQETSVCYTQCLTSKQYNAILDVCATDKPFYATCIPTNCITIKASDFESGDFSYIGARAQAVAGKCGPEEGTVYLAKAMEAAATGKASYKFCCGVNTLGAVIGGTIAGVVVLAVVGVFLWMFLAKKCLFAPKNKSQVVEKSSVTLEKENTSAPVIAQ